MAPNTKGGGQKALLRAVGTEQRGSRRAGEQGRFVSRAEIRHPPAHPRGKEKRMTEGKEVGETKAGILGS